MTSIVVPVPLLFPWAVSLWLVPCLGWRWHELLALYNLGPIPEDIGHVGLYVVSPFARRTVYTAISASRTFLVVCLLAFGRHACTAHDRYTIPLILLPLRDRARYATLCFGYASLFVIILAKAAAK